MRKILISNDDGIDAEGIVKLARVAVKFGEVWVIAPDHQCSAMSHHITLREPIDVHKVDFPVAGVHAYVTSGTPADCVRLGIPNIIKEKPDVLLTGINFGYNCGSDMQYSGTAAAAFEGACIGVSAIALSEGARGDHEVTTAFLEHIIEKLIDKPSGFNKIWNVNFPECRLVDFKGIRENRTTSPEAFFDDKYEEEPLPDGGIRMRVAGEYYERAAEGTDVRAVSEGYISISLVKNVGTD